MSAIARRFFDTLPAADRRQNSVFRRSLPEVQEILLLAFEQMQATPRQISYAGLARHISETFAKQIAAGETPRLAKTTILELHHRYEKGLPL